MPKTSKELLDHVEKPSILDGLLLSCKNPIPQTLNKQQSSVYPKERPSFTSLPKSQVLGRARDFVELMAKANKDLETKAQENPPSNYDIEVLNSDENEYIEMDLLLGVADLHSDDAVAAAEASMSGVRPAVADSEDDDDDSDDDIEDKSPITSNAKDNELSRELKPNKRPKVVMLD